MQFIVVKGHNVRALQSYSKIVKEVTGLKVLPIFDWLEVSIVDLENKSQL